MQASYLERNPLIIQRLVAKEEEISNYLHRIVESYKSAQLDLTPLKLAVCCSSPPSCLGTLYLKKWTNTWLRRWDWLLTSRLCMGLISRRQQFHPQEHPWQGQRDPWFVRETGTHLGRNSSVRYVTRSMRVVPVLSNAGNAARKVTDLRIAGKNSHLLH